MLDLKPETEALLAAAAAAAGKTPDEYVRATVADVGPTTAKASKTRLEGQALYDALEELSLRAASRPLLDPRTPDEIIGYDERGLPR